jgi:Protein of unknown function (DUF3710)
VIFSRDRGKAGRRGGGDAGRGGRHAHPRIEASDHESTADDYDLPPRPDFGPYDLDDAPDDDLARLDLGALRIPNVAGVNIELETGPAGEIRWVRLGHGGSRLELGAYAAPRSEGIWDEIRSDLRTALTARGVKVAEVEGDYGQELQARIRDGQIVTEVRHVGIDGPRWFVHGIYYGAAAVDPDQAGPLRDALRGLVVDRGTEARPVKETLPLRLPPEAAAQLAEVIANESAANPTSAAADTGTGAAAAHDGARRASPAKDARANARRTRSEAT